jgi:hypothetical protein
MTSLIEERYRRALRILPASYRSRWEEDMVATFLDSAYAANPDDPEGVELASPSRSELASIAALAVRLRLGGTEAPPRSFAWGEAVRKVALAGLLAHAMAAIAGPLIAILIGLETVTAPADAVSPSMNRWQALLVVAPSVWVAAYLLLLSGKWRVARGLAVLALAMAVATNVVGMAIDGPHPVGTRVYGLMFEALPVLALIAYHPTTPSIARGRWLIALPAGSVVLAAAVVLTQSAVDRDPLLDWAGIWSVALAVATLVWCGLSTVARLHWSVALAILGIATLGLRVISMASYFTYAAPMANRTTLVVVDTTECVIVAVAIVAVVTYAVREWRRLPDASWADPRR